MTRLGESGTHRKATEAEGKTANNMHNFLVLIDGGKKIGRIRRKILFRTTNNMKLWRARADILTIKRNFVL